MSGWHSHCDALSRDLIVKVILSSRREPVHKSKSMKKAQFKAMRYKFFNIEIHTERKSVLELWVSIPRKFLLETYFERKKHRKFKCWGTSVFIFGNEGMQLCEYGTINHAVSLWLLGLVSHPVLILFNYFNRQQSYACGLYFILYFFMSSTSVCVVLQVMRLYVTGKYWGRYLSNQQFHNFDILWKTKIFWHSWTEDHEYFHWEDFKFRHHSIP